MKLGIMQPYFFPYLGYFQLISAVDRFILYDNVNYIKKGWVNRNRLIIQGQPHFIVVPILAQSSYSKIRDIKIDKRQRLVSRLVDTVSLAYKRAPYFDDVFPRIKDLLEDATDHLAELNCLSIRSIAEFLDIPTDIVTNTSNYETLERDLLDADSDVRASYLGLQGLPDTKTMRIFSMCRGEGANTFINAIGGQALYNKDVFKRNGIDLWFVKTLQHSYRQRCDGFFPGMSIIDVLMNCGKVGTQELLGAYELV